MPVDWVGWAVWVVDWPKLKVGLFCVVPNILPDGCCVVVEVVFPPPKNDIFVDGRYAPAA